MGKQENKMVPLFSKRDIQHGYCNAGETSDEVGSRGLDHRDAGSRIFLLALSGQFF